MASEIRSGEFTRKIRSARTPIKESRALEQPSPRTAHVVNVGVPEAKRKQS
jgi:hypothetical protein